MANAAFIVKSANCHYELVEALDSILDSIYTSAGSELDDIMAEKIRKAKQALSKAKAGA